MSVQFKPDQTTRSLDWTENRNVDTIDNVNKNKIVLLRRISKLKYTNGIKLFYYIEYLN